MKINEYLEKEGIDPRLLSTKEGRIEACRYDPMLFAITYFPHKLRDSKGQITLSEFHFAMADYAKTWILKDNAPDGHWSAKIAPRGCGKSTWLFQILPTWAAAYKYKQFIAAFSDASNQAEGWLLNFKMELRTNEYLMSDFPALCEPMKGKDGRPIADSAWRTIRSNGFAFDANGIDTNALGKNVLGMRPDLIILDDIEKGEKNYSEYQAGQQKNTVIDDISPMGEPGYHMIFVGTTTMPNSIMDQFRKYADGYDDDRELDWIKERKVRVFYYPAILANDDGTERSIWPEKWSLEWLQGERHKRYFQKNFMNRPVNLDGQFWSDEDIVYSEAKEYGNTAIFVDPAVKKGKLNDSTGICVASRGIDTDGRERIFIREAFGVKMSAPDMAKVVEDLAYEYDAGVLFVETNQGGDLWKDVFKNVPCKYRAKHEREDKKVRASRALNFYQQDMVRHVKPFPTLNEQLFAFPKVAHDDVLDAAMNAVLYFLYNNQKRPRARQFNYARRNR